MKKFVVLILALSLIVSACSTAEPVSEQTLTYIEYLSYNGTHAETHENDGSDEISVAGLSGLLSDNQTPLAHKAIHELGGSDEIDVTGLEGAGGGSDNHSETHENDGDDEISVEDLSGLLADDQHVLDSEILNALNILEDYILLNHEMTGNVTLTDTTFELAGGQHFNILSAGGGQGMNYRTTAGGASGIYANYSLESTSPAINDIIYSEYWKETNSNLDLENFGYFQVVTVNVTDGGETAKLRWTLRNNGATNVAMYLYSDGTLAVDAGFDTFDEYNDAELLKDAIKDGDYQLLVDAGIYDIKYKIDDKGIETTEEDGYLVSVPNMMKLNSGGIYQLLEYCKELEARIAILEGLPEEELLK